MKIFQKTHLLLKINKLINSGFGFASRKEDVTNILNLEDNKRKITFPQDIESVKSNPDGQIHLQRLLTDRQFLRMHS